MAVTLELRAPVAGQCRLLNCFAIELPSGSPMGFMTGDYLPKGYEPCVRQNNSRAEPTRLSANCVPHDVNAFF